MQLLIAIILIHSAPFDEVAQGPSPSKEIQEFSLKGGKTILVTQIEFSGNKSIPSAQLERLVSPFENKSLSENNLKEIQYRVALLYRSKGFRDVEVLIPQKQASGSLSVVIKEGKKS